MMNSSEFRAFFVHPYTLKGFTKEEVFMDVQQRLKALFFIVSFTFIFFTGQWVEAEWQIETVESTRNVGQGTSLVLDSSDNPHISYYDETNQNLKYASNNGAWNTETVDSSGSVGSFPSLSLDSGGAPRISYYDEVNRNLKYAFFNGTWQAVTADDTGAVGRFTSLALDSSENPHISYYDNANGALKYAFNDGSWNIETVDSTADVGAYSSLALDSSGNSHISYYDNTNGALKYAFNNGSWNIEIVDSTADVGAYSSLALDSSDNPHISYYDATNKDLKYALFIPAAGATTSTIEPGMTTTTSTVDPGATTTTSTIDPGATTTTSTIDPNATTTTNTATFSISGTITGVIRSNVPVVLTGAASRSTNTNLRGNYEFPALVSGGYIITPVLAGYIFEPASLEISHLTSDLFDMDFVSSFAPLCAPEVLYGENSEQVQLLRILRDEVLSKTPVGREIIRLYYEWSPVIVKVMGRDEEFKKEIKEMIDEILEELVEKAEISILPYENTGGQRLFPVGNLSQ
jgi:hypothetical protein